MPKASRYLKKFRQHLPWFLLLTNILIWFALFVTRGANQAALRNPEFESVSLEKLVLRDDDKNVRFQINTLEDGSVEFVLKNAKGESMVHLHSFDDSVDLMVGSPQNGIVLRSGSRYSEVAFVDRDLTPRIRLIRDGTETALVMLDHSGTSSVGLFNSEQRRQLAFFDPLGRPRVELMLDAEGARFMLQDESQTPRTGVSLNRESPNLVIHDSNAIARGLVEQVGYECAALVNQNVGLNDTVIRVGGEQSMSRHDAFVE